jgi:hypothetical protein
MPLQLMQAQQQIHPPCLLQIPKVGRFPLPCGRQGMRLFRHSQQAFYLLEPCFLLLPASSFSCQWWRLEMILKL